ncbi:MAG: hypothetical protein JNL82_32295 [Myxococcales bacterium]|nr:hypothetical protein [Myxococcales bacterium]
MSALVAPRLDEPAPGPTSGPEVEPPVLAAIRCIYGVGAAPEASPEGDGLRPVYCVDLPVDAPGSLDADDTHEFDAASLLGDLQSRARARAWAMRLELDVVQTARGAGTDLFLDPPDEVGMRLLHGVALPGGGRRLTFGTGLAHTPEAAARLAGVYAFTQRASDGSERGVCRVALGLTEYEFE